MDQSGLISAAHKRDEPVSQKQRIIIQNNYGQKLVGVLHETGSVELVILCHGFRCSKESSIITNLATVLEKEGISAFRFDFSGNGMCSHGLLFPYKGTAVMLLRLQEIKVESEGSFQYGNYGGETDDLHAVVLHFSRLKRLITAILGHSKGGDVVLLYASRFPDVHTVINVSGRFYMERGIEDRLGKDFMERIKKDGFIDVWHKTGKVAYRVTKESLMDRLNTDMHAASLSIKRDCRVLTIHGSMDEIVPIEDALEFSKIIPNHKLHMVERADHAYSSHQDDLASIVSDFIKTGLQQDKDVPNHVQLPKGR
ncbi:PREDICTED: uncharacterized protein LOC104600705 isoform X1 [Nelumbo nucifera]|uniref:Uncharacterized protein LOC104600705 isoform X1 n=1 Tax=Nelumbo nucifera TaxID=4432 RepID=A0A1U8AIW4_NELNU|nr:PREDICTED: uncharacterized protein LOC104600705 isoform X1 [Nelumbo nucifera]